MNKNTEFTINKTADIRSKFLPALPIGVKKSLQMKIASQEILDSLDRLKVFSRGISNPSKITRRLPKNQLQQLVL
jgi:hypothetical protein